MARFCEPCRLWSRSEDAFVLHLAGNSHRKRSTKYIAHLARQTLYWVYQRSSAEAELRTARSVLPLALPGPAWQRLEAFLNLPEEFKYAYFGERQF